MELREVLVCRPSVTPSTVLDCMMGGSYTRCRLTSRPGQILMSTLQFYGKRDAALENHTRGLLRSFLSYALPSEDIGILMSLSEDILDNPENTSGHYKVFTIPKKSGGRRTIEAPEGNLKMILRASLDKWWYTKRPPDPLMHGFVPGRGCLTNAYAHVENDKFGRDKVLFKTDMSDLFPSITRTSVMNALIDDLGSWKEYSRKNRRVPKILFDILMDAATKDDAVVHVDKSVLSGAYENGIEHGAGRGWPHWPIVLNELCLDHVLLRLACLDERLPQGSPCSPVLANIFTRRFHQIARANIRSMIGEDFDYTAYADDTCVTFPYDDDYEKRARLTRLAMYRTASSYPDIVINRDKTGLFKPGTAQRVTGITITDKLSISRKDRDKVRAELHAACTGAKALSDEDKMRLRGVRAWMRGVDSKGWDSRCEDEFLKVVGK